MSSCPRRRNSSISIVPVGCALEHYARADSVSHGALINYVCCRQILRSNPQRFVDGDVIVASSTDDTPAQNIADLTKNMAFAYQPSIHRMLQLARLGTRRSPRVNKEARPGNDIVVSLTRIEQTGPNQIHMRTALKPRSIQNGLTRCSNRTNNIRALHRVLGRLADLNAHG